MFIIYFYIFMYIKLQRKNNNTVSLGLEFELLYNLKRRFLGFNEFGLEP